MITHLDDLLHPYGPRLAVRLDEQPNPAGLVLPGEKTYLTGQVLAIGREGKEEGFEVGDHVLLNSVKGPTHECTFDGVSVRVALLYFSNIVAVFDERVTLREVSGPAPITEVDPSRLETMQAIFQQNE